MINGAIISKVFLSMFMEILSWPTECVLLDFKIILRISLIVGIGIIKVLGLWGNIFFKISMGVTGTLGISLRNLAIVSI